MIKTPRADYSLSVILPALNEAASVGECCTRVYGAVKTTYPNPQIIVVDDGSKDCTSQIVRSLQGQVPNLVLLRNERTIGKARSLVRGFEVSTGDLVCFLDSDLDIPPEQIVLLLQTLSQRSADVVVGSKYHKLSSVRYPLFRLLLGKSYRYCMHLLFSLPVTDTQCGIKLFKREVLERSLPHLHVSSFAYDLELFLILLDSGFLIAEVPVDVHLRGVGGANLVALWKTFQDTLRLYLSYRISRTGIGHAQ